MNAITKEPREQLEEADKLRQLADQLEHNAVKAALTATGGNIRQAADVLSLPPRTLDKRLRDGRLKDLRKMCNTKVGNPGTPRKPRK